MKSSTKTKSSKKGKKETNSLLTFSLVENSNYTYFQLACIVFFVLTAYFLTAVLNNNFLKWAEEISLFIPTKLFFMQSMKTAGGLLSYIGIFLTQFYYYPLLGSTVFILLLLLVQLFTIKSFEIPKHFFPLTFIPSVVLLSSITEVGDVLFSLKSPGYLFSNTIGILFCLSFFILYRKIEPWSIRTIVWIFVVLTYPLFGFYSLFAVFLGVIYEIFSLVKDRNKYRIITIVSSLFFVLIAPYLSYTYIYSQMQLGDIYIAGLPKFDFTENEFDLWIPFIILFISILFFLIFLLKKKPVNKTKVNIYAMVSFCVFIIFLFGCYSHSFRDENFKTELKMTEAIENNDWGKVVSIGDKIKGDPTRLIIMNNNLALCKMGRAGDQMFSMSNNSMLPVSRRPTLLMMHMGARSVYYQYGKINFCYRWCMEDMVEYGMRVNLLKYMVKCSILNGEFALAQKYNNVLNKTLFHKQWAAKYQKYIDNHELIAEDREFKAIKPLMAYEDVLDGDGNLLELYVLNSFAYMRGGPPELVELSLQCNLVLKNIERFWPRYFLYARTHDRVPIHYQEAALLYAYLENKLDISKFNFNKEVVDKFNLMISMSKQYADKSDEYNKAVFKPQFGDSFWYYYFFIKDIQTN